MKHKKLRDLIVFKKTIKEDATAPLQAADPNQLQNDSFDAQVDRIFLQSDKQKDDENQFESFLREEADDADNTETSTKQIDAVSFADGIARLAEKFENVIDIKGTIVRRAINYVTKNYDPKQAKTVQQVLAGNFGLEVTDNPSMDDGEGDKTPVAKGAGPTGQE